MIDFEITVDVEGLTHEEKMRVQDAFFKLGFTWWDGVKYSCLNRDCYTNKMRFGKVTQNLMWTDASTKPTHTVDELLELAGMKTDTKPFDLEKALAGEPVVTREGRKAYVRHHETELAMLFPLIGYIFSRSGNYDLANWRITGENFGSEMESLQDIVGMWSEPLVFGHWDALHPSINYIAKDLDGEWYGYTGKTFPDESEWLIDKRHDNAFNLETINPNLFPECDWKDSLIKRPENE